jgi:protein-tyrosine phosphatase
MVDLHCHAIYDVDDGSKNIDQTIRMIKNAEEIGYDAICFTPHYMEDGYRTSKVVLEQKLNRIRDLVKLEGIRVDLYLGEEIFIFPDLAENIDDVLTLNNTKYVLFELPLLESLNYVDDVVYKLQSLGFVPILAHPERYYRTVTDFKYIEDLAKKGVLLQININSLIGRYGKQAKLLATKMLKKDMCAIVATDAHSSTGYISAKESLEILEKIVGEDKAYELTSTNPRKILNNEEVNPWSYRKLEKKNNNHESIFKKVFFISKLIKK